jgi:hypothetical protein
MNIDGTRVNTYSILAAVYAQRGMIAELDSVFATAEKRVPDDLSPYYRAAEVLLSKGQDLERAQRYFGRYLSAEPEGNTPTLAEARGKLDVLAKTRSVSGTRATLGPG